MKQLSLSLDLSNHELVYINWFQQFLTTLGVIYEPAWTDKFGKALHRWLTHKGYPPHQNSQLIF